MFSYYGLESEATSYIPMKIKDAACLGIANYHMGRISGDAEFFIVNGKRYDRYIPKIGDLIVCVCHNKYSITGPKSICRVLQIRFDYPDDILVRVEKSTLHDSYVGQTFWVTSLLYRKATIGEKSEID